MITPLNQKSTPDAIRRRFDAEVERFSNLETGQQAVMDAALMLDLISETAAAICPQARHLLDIGCGAGNNAIRICRLIPGLNCDLNDLSRPMLERAEQRLHGETSGKIRRIRGDIREVEIQDNHYDLVVAAAVLHHLRDDADWRAVLGRVHRSMKPGGALLVSDIVFHEIPAVQKSLWRRYGDHLISLGGEDYREQVFDCIDQEDSPRSVTFHTRLMGDLGFRQVDILHKSACFAALVAVK